MISIYMRSNSDCPSKKSHRGEATLRIQLRGTRQNFHRVTSLRQAKLQKLSVQIFSEVGFKKNPEKVW